MGLNAWFFSEKQAPRTDRGTWNGCRVATIANCVMDATWNEGAMYPSGRPMGMGGRKGLLVKGLKGADGNWRADAGFNQGDVDEISKAMFPHLPLPQYVATTNFSGLIKHLPAENSNKKYPDEGFHVISISLRLSVLDPSDAGRRYTSADHQVKLSKRRKRSGQWWLLVTDPMHTASNTYKGHWVKQSSIGKAAKAIVGGGVVIAEIYPIKGWTAEALGTAAKDRVIVKRNKTIAAKNEIIESKNAKIGTLSTEVRELKRTNTSLEADMESLLTDISVLERDLEACQAGGNSSERVDVLEGAIDTAVDLLITARSTD